MLLLSSVCKIRICMNVCCVVIVNVSIACRNFLKVLMLLPVQFKCTVLKVGYSVIVSFSLFMHLNPIFSCAAIS